MGKTSWVEPEKSGEGKQRVATSKGLSGWTKVGIIAGGGMVLFFFAVFMYLNSTGILPAANRLGRVRAEYAASGAPQTMGDVEKLYGVPKEDNAALILDYVAGTKGTKTRIEFPLAGKKGGERYTVSWKEFVNDVDRAASRPHFRPKREFDNPYSILLPEFSLFRGAMGEFLRQAEASVEKGDFTNAERHVVRACHIDRWSTDQPFLIAKIVRINGVADNLRLVGKLVSLPPGRPEPTRMIGHLKAAAERRLEVADVAAVETFALSRVGEILAEPGNSSLYTPYAGTSGVGATPLTALEDRAFEFAAKSSLGITAITSLSLEVAAKYHDTWKKSRDLDKAFDDGGKALLKHGDNRLVKAMGNILPMVTGSGVNDSIEVRPRIHAQILEIAQWVYNQRLNSKFDLATLSASGLPSALRYDVLGNPITVVKSGNELRIYSFGADRSDDGGGSKDTGFSILLKPR